MRRPSLSDSTTYECQDTDKGVWDSHKHVQIAIHLHELQSHSCSKLGGEDLMVTENVRRNHIQVPVQETPPNMTQSCFCRFISVLDETVWFARFNPARLGRVGFLERMWSLDYKIVHIANIRCPTSTELLFPTFVRRSNHIGNISNLINCTSHMYWSIVHIVINIFSHLLYIFGIS